MHVKERVENHEKCEGESSNKTRMLDAGKVAQSLELLFVLAWRLFRDNGNKWPPRPSEPSDGGSESC